MKTIIAAVLAIFIFQSGIVAQTIPDDLGHYDIHVIFEPATTTPGYYEVLERIEYQTKALSPETDDIGLACVIYLHQEEMLPGDGIPLDASGQQKIRLDDGLTWLSTKELYDLAAYDENCLVALSGV